MAVNRTVVVTADTLRQMVCVFDGLVQALEGIATSGRSAYRESVRKDAQTLRELRGELVPGNVNWMAGSYEPTRRGAPRSHSHSPRAAAPEAS